MNFSFSPCQGGYSQPSEEDINRMDAKLARDMMQLATSEREHALNDLHGIAEEEFNESPAMIASSLAKLDEEIRRMSHGTAYEQAEMISKDYVSSDAFRLVFLRSEDFDAREAAAGMIRYFDDKLVLFGREMLTKDIRLSDLNENDIKILSSGFVQVLPTKDASGRTVVAYLKGLRPANNYESVGRALWYVMNSLLENEEIQKKGIVYIIHHVDAKVKDSCLAVVLLVAKLFFRTIPIRKNGTHLCCDGAAVRPLAAAAVNIMNGSDRVRYRVHVGSHLECMYELRTFGIRTFPADLHGNFLIEEHLRWLKMRHESENRAAAVQRESPQPVSVRSPGAIMGIGPTDVLFGRGAPVRDNPGNTRFRKIVDQYAQRYESAERLEKGCIAYAVVVMVNESNGRFLQRSAEGGWKEVDPGKARDKVHQTFRNIRHQK